MLTRVSASRRFSSSARRAPSASSSARRSAAEFALHFEAAREEILEPPFELVDRLIAAGQRGFQLVAARLGLQPLIGHALEADAHRALAGAARFDADQQVAARELRRLPARARQLHFLATFFAFGFQSRAPRIERVERHQAAIQLGAGARQRVLRRDPLRA